MIRCCDIAHTQTVTDSEHVNGGRRTRGGGRTASQHLPHGRPSCAALAPAACQWHPRHLLSRHLLPPRRDEAPGISGHPRDPRRIHERALKPHLPQAAQRHRLPGPTVARRQVVAGPLAEELGSGDGPGLRVPERQRAVQHRADMPVDVRRLLPRLRGVRRRTERPRRHEPQQQGPLRGRQGKGDEQ